MIEQRPKIGVLGGGQLGRMLALAAAPLDLDISFLDKSSDAPVAAITHRFALGDYANYDDVMHFGSDKDIITIEIEHVNIQALKDLQSMGKKVYPLPEQLELIQDKMLQKLSIQQMQIGTARFEQFENAQELRDSVLKGKTLLPFVQKSRKGGYDGKGVMVVKKHADLAHLLDCPCIAEEFADFSKEISVIAARNANGEIEVFDPVEMDFDSEANLVKFLRCPADVSEQVKEKAKAIAMRVANGFHTVGLLAVEMFVLKNDEVIVNEVAPRPHNSGHHTIETAAVSQFEQHLRAILNLSLAPAHQLRPAVMINLLGAEGHKGPVAYRGLEKALEKPYTHIHLYGKKTTSPMRKMGHITVSGETIEDAIESALYLDAMVRVEAEQTGDK